MIRTRRHALVPGGLLALALLPALAPGEAAAGAVCPDTDSVALIAGQRTPAGEVKVCNDAETLAITYEPTGPWCVADTNLHVATGLDGIPRTRSGNPQPDEFAYGGPPEWDECTVTLEIPLDEIGAEGVAPEDTVVIAAQADLFVLEGDRREGAWGAGTRFTERGPWATYFTYTVEDGTCGEDSLCVFVTSSTHNGNLGGLAGADTICQGRAQAEGSLAAPGTYQAWLSDGTVSPATRFTGATNLPYRLVDGTEIAKDWNDLTDGTLGAPISVDEAGQAVSAWPGAWTNTGVNGAPAGSDHNCIGWSTTTGPNFGRAGFPGETGSKWTVDRTFGLGTAFNCVEQFRLYCFQQ